MAHPRHCPRAVPEGPPSVGKHAQASSEPSFPLYQRLVLKLYIYQLLSPLRSWFLFEQAAGGRQSTTEMIACYCKAPFIHRLAINHTGQ